MRQIKKDTNSPARDLVYSNVNQRDKIKEILLQEQSNICAYTEYYLDRGSSKPIEHFNPTLKGTDQDGYNNYFICRDQWNMEKGKTARWNQYQPVLHPSEPTFESIIYYKDGLFFSNEESGNNLIKYLKLNDPELYHDRKTYVSRKKKEIEFAGSTSHGYFQELLEDKPEHIYFIRTIEEEFYLKIDLTNKQITQKI